MNKRIFLDMDGVITGFNARTNILLEAAGHPEYESDLWKNFDDLDQVIWPLIKEDQNFWTELPFLEEGRTLWNAIKVYRPSILSAYTDKDERCEPGKMNWIYNNLELDCIERILIVRRSEKKNYAAPDAVLIDDHQQNVDEFIEAGGHAILYTGDAQETLDKLQEIASTDT